MRLPSRFLKTLELSGAIPPGSSVLVAVSGGADSVALLHLLNHAAHLLSLSLTVAHLDHALRATSLDDARFVAQMCTDLGVPLVAERRDVARIARQNKGNLEEVAREERREFLATVARNCGCHLIALGHHADDQAETFVMRLLRGSGSTGLSGMRLADGPLVRPLLLFRREDILAFLLEEGIPWREDESNRDTGLTRNRIRHDLLPRLESFNPKIGRRIAALCEQLQQDEDYWRALTRDELAGYGRWREGQLVLDRVRLLGMAPALAGRVVREALREVRGDLRGLTADHVSAVLGLARTGPPQGELDLPEAWVARRYDELLLGRQRPEAAQPFAMTLEGPGVYALPGDRTLRVSLEPERSGEQASVVEFAATALLFPLRLRSCQPGDRLQPSGMPGTKKLQDLFVDLKLPRESRQQALLLLKDEEPLWVVGVRRAEGWRPVGGEAVLRIVVEP